MNILKGIIIGIAKVIPGVSGTVLMISFNLYDKAINAITCFFDKPRNNFWFLFKLFIGVMIGIVFFSRLVTYFITNYYLYTISLFIGLILGGVTIVKREVKKSLGGFLLSSISFFIMLILSYSNMTRVYIMKNTFIDILVFFISGILEAVGMILPGVSSTALLMIMGVYPYYLKVLSNLFNISFMIKSLNFLIPFGLGVVSGIIGISLIVNYLFKYYKESTFSVILGLSIATIITLFLSLITYINNLISIFLVVFFIVIGFLITKFIN